MLFRMVFRKMEYTPFVSCSHPSGFREAIVRTIITALILAIIVIVHDESLFHPPITLYPPIIVSPFKSLRRNNHYPYFNYSPTPCHHLFFRLCPHLYVMTLLERRDSKAIILKSPKLARSLTALLTRMRSSNSHPN
jgi:hypothetical protein